MHGMGLIYPWIACNTTCKGFVKFLPKLILYSFELHNRNTIPGDFLVSIHLALAYYSYPNLSSIYVLQGQGIFGKDGFCFRHT